jgi:hypothetical protein
MDTSATLSIGSKVGMNGPFIPIGGLIDPIRFRDSELEKQNVFCMFALDGDLQNTGLNSL